MIMYMMMKQNLKRIRDKIQNDSPEFIIDALITEISVTSDFAKSK
jgi:hypothetical protein